jgi:Protein of unknown function (DUF4058)
MPSPFPGMNPYLEQFDAWLDFHHRLIDRMADAIADQVDPRYLVKIDEHLYLQEAPREPHRLGPRVDVGVKPGTLRAAPGPGTAVLEAPARIHLPWSEAEPQAFLEIRDRASRELVTVLELLSPTNKGRDRDQYLLKRDQVLISTAHLVEVDLLRGGAPPPATDRSECDYSVVVSRAELRPEADFWPIRLRDRLPVVLVPLRAPDQAAKLDLQELLHRVYDAGRYVRYIYESPPASPLRQEDEAWALQFFPAVP